ncbi:MAG: adenosylmethionine--8-amino-7-oxononanoate transaminase [Nitrospinota bacterium]
MDNRNPQGAARPGHSRQAVRSEAADLDRRHLWHPFTQMLEWEKEDFPVIVRGEGVYLIDEAGTRYLDGVSSLWCNVHGHGQARIVEAISKQAAELDHSTLLGLAHPVAARLAERLIAAAPRGLTRVFYSDNGATAVEIALKIAFQYQLQRTPPRPEKRKFMALTEAYHGDTLGAMSVGGIDLFHETYRPLLFETHYAEAPYCYRCPFGKTYPECSVYCAGEMEGAIRRHAAELAAFIVEPVMQGAGGMIAAPEGFLRRIRKVCDECDVLLIADEVATGFGRTGRMWACDHEEVSPDLMALAKGLTGGTLPLAATLTTERIYDAFLGDYGSKRTFYHGHTYTGNPIACAAALASLEIFEEERTLERLPGKIALLSEELERFKALPHVGDVRQRGLMVGIELVLDEETKEPYPFERRIGHRVTLEARRRGLITRPLGNVVVLMPPLSTPDDLLREMARITYESIRAAREGS